MSVEVAMTTITANGKPREVEELTTIAEFLRVLGWRPEWVVVEHNGEPVERPRFDGVVLRAGDRLEVVRAVAGGAR
jgi:sulfur carrier protein